MVLLWLVTVVATGATIFLAVRTAHSTKDSRSFRLQLLGTVLAAGLAVLCLLGAMRVGKLEQEVAAREQAQFARQIQPVADELERLDIKPMVQDGFYETDNYRLIEPNNRNIGMVAVKNALGHRIWVGYEIHRSDRVSIGCLIEGKIYPTTPAGAKQLLGTKGCDW